jgi:hypothetical protein
MAENPPTHHEGAEPQPSPHDPHPVGEHGAVFLNWKADFDDYRKDCKSLFSHAQSHFDTLQSNYAEEAKKLSSAHSDLVRQLNDQYATHSKTLNDNTATHIADLNRETINDIGKNRENMRHLLNRLVNLDPEEAVSIEKIMNEPFMAALKTVLVDAVAEIIDKKKP